VISDYELVIGTGMAKIHNHTARIGLAAVESCPGAKSQLRVDHGCSQS
jgi:hypothetical protein